MKKSNKRRTHILLWILILTLFLAGAVFAMAMQKQGLPERNLGDTEGTSLMLSADGDSLSVSKDLLDQKSKKKKKDDKKEGKEKAKKGSEKGKPRKGQTDLVYFTTTIKDGETVTKKAYDFSIHHKISNLTPKRTRIYVNGTLEDDIKDARTDFNLLLKEGRNRVRVQVTYENAQGVRFSPYKDYVIKVDTRRLVIQTSLVDGQEVESAFLSFTASASFGDEDVNVTVKHDGTTLYEGDGVYETELQKGENLITISSHYDSKRKAKETYRITYNPPKGMHIETDLENQTVKAVDPGFSFRAEVVGGNSKTKFTVTFNNKTIRSEDGHYQVELVPQGIKAYNTIRLKATDGKNEDALTFKIKYVPIATAETEPKLTHLNVKNGQTIRKNNPYTIEIAAEDYQGNEIGYDGVEVYLNGKHQILRDTHPYITYQLNFDEGSNTVRLKLTDADGREKEFTYTITYVKPSEDESAGHATVTVDARVLGKGTILNASNIEVKANDTLASVIVRAIESKGYSVDYSGSTSSAFYLKAINRANIGKSYRIPEALIEEINESAISWQGSEENPDHSTNSLGQFDFTNGSGWMIVKNGNFIGESASGVDVSDGDIIKIRFTLAFGMDVGSTYQGNSFHTTY